MKMEFLPWFSFIALLLMACAVTTEQRLSETRDIHNPRYVHPKASYESVWNKLRQCVDGFSRPEPKFSDINWVVADSLYNTVKNEVLWGLHIEPNTIIIVEYRASDLEAVGHEMLHNLLPHLSHQHILFQDCDPIIHPSVIQDE